MTRLPVAWISPDPVDPAELLAIVSRPDAGAAVLFVGVVRDHDPQANGRVVALDYSAHPSASDRIGEIVASAVSVSDPEGRTMVAAVHRIGHLGVGDNAFVVAVSAPHRGQAFAVCEHVVEQVKAQLPVWKQQFEADGSYRWSGL